MKRLLILLMGSSLLLPMDAVLAKDFTYSFPVPGCKTTYSRYHHDYPAADIFAKNGCAFVAPIDGVVAEVSRDDTWSGRENLGETRGGKYVSLLGDDGVRYYGSHLRSVAKGIKVGVRVPAGEKLGEIGTSGSARGTPPHLHFGISWPTEDGIWWVRRGMVSPYAFLQAWQSGEMKSPRRQVIRKLAEVGEIPPQPKK
jgi:peptidoglycan LD-endopeptidase LytH